MKKQTNILFSGSLLALIITITAGCGREDCDDPVPSLSYDSFQKINNDTFELAYDFKDCDGDIGLDPDDDEPPFDQENEYYYNFKVNLLYKEEGAWKKYEFGEDVPGLNDRIRRIREGEKDKPLEGQIEKFIDRSTFDPFLDTIKFRAVLVDRDLNESEPADSEELILQNYL